MNLNINPVNEYIKSTQNICLSTLISILLIFFIVISPLKQFIMASFIGKLIIIILLAFILYFNIILTNKFSNNLNISLINGQWNILKTNLTCSYIFSLFLFILILSILRCLF